MNTEMIEFIKPDFSFRTPLCTMLSQKQPHGCRLLVDVRINLEVFNIEQRGGLQFDAPHDAVPVALCLVGHAVGVGSHAHVFDSVVHAYGQCVLAASDPSGQVEDVRD